MPKYNYLAKSRTGELSSGIREAKDRQELARILRDEGFILIRAELIGGLGEKKKIPFPFSFFKGVSLVERVMFTRNLRVMVMSGIALPRALAILAQQAKSKKFKKALLKTKDDIIKGTSFSEALAEHPGIFSEVFINMIKVGEESGTLEKVLQVLTDQMEKEHQIKSKIKGAMVYPAVIILAMVIIGIVMLIMVVPKLSKVFIELGVELPLTTQIVIAIGTFLSRFWYLLPLGLVILIILFRLALKTKMGRLAFDTIVLKTPVVSLIVKKSNAARTARTLSSLIASGVPIVRSLEIVSGALGNIYYKEAMAQSAERVRKGAKLAEALKDYQNIYPDLVIQMMAVGEETGETSNILEKLADFFEDEVSNATKNLSAVIEPVLMLIIGAIVGFFAISMVQPIYSMMQTL